jgi:hypothetical protein
VAIGWLGFIRTIQQVVRYLATIAAGLDQQRCSATLIATAAFGFLAMTGGEVPATPRLLERSPQPHP